MSVTDTTKRKAASKAKAKTKAKAKVKPKAKAKPKKAVTRTLQKRDAASVTKRDAASVTKQEAQETQKAQGRTKPITPGKDSSTGQFLPGNGFWKKRTTHGRPRLFASSDALWEACVEYFEAVESSPLYETKADKGILYRLPKPRPMTIGGLSVFLDIDVSTWNTWRKEPDYSAVCTRVEAIIRDQKFAGAAAELFNANIIARDLGLAEKVDSNTLLETHEERLRRLMQEDASE